MGRFGYVLILLLVILCAFVFLQPALSYQLFPQKREALLTSFITSLQKSTTLDPVRYWEFREFYSPGVFTFSKEYSVHSLQIPSVLQTDVTNLEKKHQIKPYLVFHSDSIDSFDAITRSPIDVSTINKSKKYIINEHWLSIADEGTYYYLMAVTPSAMIQKADGFFQDNGSSPPPTNEYYLTVARIKKD